ncbi:hypothetical protein NA56DRAFT_710939 [Hyaloscypha hepaticicola]|uniref:Uncharacterized protein n=1 Tax=Hyaloscypha hepaticicola TaxID=2082293 RepID=A0A2J6PK29_9HELO|nr:hypothetical protein NA56DRAFT_710939 [Hyaloscypha hepaticicola]
MQAAGRLDFLSSQQQGASSKRSTHDDLASHRCPSNNNTSKLHPNSRGDYLVQVLTRRRFAAGIDAQETFASRGDDGVDSAPNKAGLASQDHGTSPGDASTFQYNQQLQLECIAMQQKSTPRSKYARNATILLNSTNHYELERHVFGANWRIDRSGMA